MSQSELRLQKRIAAFIESRGGVARIAQAKVVGDPDIYACVAGRFVQMEVKDGDGYEVQEIQAYRLNEWKRAGAAVFVVRTFEEAQRAINSLADSALRFRKERD